MNRIIMMCLDAALSALILIPVFLILNRFVFCSNAKTTCYFIFAIYLSGMFAVVGLPTVKYVRFDPNINIVPFSYMFSDYENSILNVLLFLPFGFFLPFFWKYFKAFHRTLFFGFCASLFIEVLQLFTFRATDINDLITNTLGTFLGWFLAKVIIQLFPSISPSRKTGDAYLISGLSFVIMFFIQPFFADFLFPLLF